MSQIREIQNQTYFIIEYLPVRVPKIALEELTHLIAPEHLEANSIIELVVSIQGENLNIREFGAYLSFIDRVYGRLSQEGIHAYVHNEKEQLTIARMRQGSIEVVIERVFSELQDTRIVVLWLVLKYLPNLLKSSAEALKNIANAYNEYEQGRLARENRKILRAQLKKEELMRKLSPTKLDQLVKFLATVYAQESYKLAAPIRFAQKFVSNVLLRTRK